MTEVLLNSERQIVVIRRLVVYVEALRVGGRQKTGCLQECVHVAVVSNRRKDRGRIIYGITPFAHAHVIENGRAAAYRGLAVAENIPGEAEPRAIEDGLLIHKSTGIVLIAGRNSAWSGVAHIWNEQPHVSGRKQSAG